MLDTRTLVLSAPERTHRPPAPAIATLLERPLDGGWRRTRVSALPPGVPVVESWTSVDLTSGLYDRTGVVVLDGVSP